MAYSQLGSRLVGTGYAGTYGPREGQSVAISGDGSTLAIGAGGDGSGTTYVGAVWIFTWNGNAWVQQGSKLVGTGIAGAACRQGTSVALSYDGNTLAVGAPADNSQRGAVWIWTRSGGIWSQQGSKLSAADYTGSNPPNQGQSVSLSGDGNTLAYGGYADGNAGSGAVGATWIWNRSGGIWTETAKLIGSSSAGASGVRQGWSVGLSGDGFTLVVGGPYDANTRGAVWVFSCSGGVWSQFGSKIAGPGGTINYFGNSVAISSDGSTIATGAFRDPTTAPYIGSAWVYTLVGGAWTQQGPKLQGTGYSPNGSPQQGYCVALSADGNLLASGGYTDNNGIGATWVFARSGGVWSQVGAGKLLGAPTSGINSAQGSSLSFYPGGHFLAVGTPGWGGQTDATGNVGGCFIFVADAQTFTQASSASLATASGSLATSATVHKHAAKSLAANTATCAASLAAVHRQPKALPAVLSPLSGSITVIVHRVPGLLNASTATAIGSLTKRAFKRLAATRAAFTGSLTGKHLGAQPLAASLSALSGTLALHHNIPSSGLLAGTSTFTGAARRVAVASGTITGASTASLAPLTELLGATTGGSTLAALPWWIASASSLSAGTSDATGTLISAVHVIPDTAAALNCSTAAATGTRERWASATATGTAIVAGTLVAVGTEAVIWAVGNLPNGSGASVAAIRVAVTEGELDGAGDTFATPFLKGNGWVSSGSTVTGTAQRIRLTAATSKGQAIIQGTALHLLLATGSTPGSSTALFEGASFATGILAGANEADADSVETFAARTTGDGLVRVHGSAVKDRFAEGVIAGSSTAALEPTLPVAGLATCTTSVDAVAARIRWLSVTVTGSSAIHGGLLDVAADTHLAAAYSDLVGDLRLIQGIRGYATGANSVRGRSLASVQTAIGRIRSNAIVTGTVGFDLVASGEAGDASAASAIPNANVVLATADLGDNAGTITGDFCYWLVADGVVPNDSDTVAEPLCILGGQAFVVTDPVVVAAQASARESIRGKATSFSLAAARVAPNVYLTSGGLGGQSSLVYVVLPIVAAGDDLNGITDLRGYLASTVDGRGHSWSVFLLAGCGIRTKPITGKVIGRSAIYGQSTSARSGLAA